MSSSNHDGIIYFRSESAGLAANALCAFVTALANFGVQLSDTLKGVSFVLIGGALQLACALRSFRAFDHFGGSVFGFFSAFWAIIGFEILTTTSIDFLHLPLLLVNVSLCCAAPFVNSFYTLTLGSICILSSLELAIRFDDEPGIKIAAGVAEIIVCCLTVYGAMEEVLHGLHGSHVLPGFQDAVVETVLWKRTPLQTDYSDGKWGNPKALQLFCSAMGISALAIIQNAESLPFIVNAISICYWLATFSGILWLVSLLHALRGEQFMAVSSIAQSGLFAVLSYDAGIATSQNENEDVNIALFFFGLLCLILLCHAAFQKASVLDLLTFASFYLALTVGSIQGFLNTKAMSYFSMALFGLSMAFDLYNAIASLVNAVAQKIVLPIGAYCGEKSGPDINTTEKTQDDDVELALADGTDDTDTDDTDTMDFTYPDDDKILGHSDFKTPLHVLFLGLSIYSALSGVGLLTNSEELFFQGLIANLLVQGHTGVICLSRGQTSLGFLSFTFALCALSLTGPMGVHFNPIQIAQPILQLLWLASSYSIFHWLSGVTALHILSVAVLSLYSFLPSEALRITSGVLFSLMACATLIILVILLGCEHFKRCKHLIKITSLKKELPCEIGFANDRNEFDRCIQILKQGGVVCIPTDTVYCLACAANHPDAIKRIYEIKNRPSEKPLSLWLGSIEEIRKVGPEGKGWTPKLMSLMDSLWPGSVSLVVSRGKWLNRMGIGDAADLIGTTDSIALRVPNSTLTVSLLQETGPLAITSANPSGACDCTHHNKVDSKIANKIDYILADGSSPMTIASSVVDVRDIDDGKLFFYRVGCVPESFIWKKFHNVGSGAPISLASFSSVEKIRSAQKLMASISSLVNCASWRIFFACPVKEGRLSWEEISNINPPVIASFETSITYYNNDYVSSSKSFRPLVDCSLGVNLPIQGATRAIPGDVEPTEVSLPPVVSNLNVPVIANGRVCAVLQLLDKMDHGGRLQTFSSEDLNTVKLARQQVLELIEVCELAEDVDWKLETSISIVDDSLTYESGERQMS